MVSQLSIVASKNLVLSVSLTCTPEGTKQWSTVRMDARPPRGRSGHSAILHGMNMYVWGGECDGVYFNELLHFDVNARKSIFIFLVIFFELQYTSI